MSNPPSFMDRVNAIADAEVESAAAESVKQEFMQAMQTMLRREKRLNGSVGAVEPNRKMRRRAQRSR